MTKKDFVVVADIVAGIINSYPDVNMASVTVNTAEDILMKKYPNFLHTRFRQYLETFHGIRIP